MLNTKTKSKLSCWFTSHKLVSRLPLGRVEFNVKDKGRIRVRVSQGQD